MAVFLAFSPNLAVILVFPCVIGGLEAGLGPKAVSDNTLFEIVIFCLIIMPVSDTVLEFQGLTMVQVSQNQVSQTTPFLMSSYL